MAATAPKPAEVSPPQMAWVMERISIVPPLYPEPNSAQDVRANFEASAAARPANAPYTLDLLIPGPEEGQQIPCRLYVPRTPPVHLPRRRLPLLIFFHGGCWFFNSIATHDAVLCQLCNASTGGSNMAGEDGEQHQGFAILSVEYRLGPEHQFPAGFEDCYAVTAWASEHAHLIGCDASRMAVGGDSSGGNLAAAVCMLAKERAGPTIAAQLLLYPVTAAPDPIAHPSQQTYGAGYGFTAAVNAAAWLMYSPPPREGDSGQYSSLVDLLTYPDLSGLPPAIFAFAECDVVLDEGLAFAAKLEAAGVLVTQRLFKGCLHGFLSLTAVAVAHGFHMDDCADEANAFSAQALNAVFYPRVVEKFHIATPNASMS